MLLAGDTFSASYHAAPDSVAAARNALAKFAREAGATDEQMQAIRLVVSEAITNAVVHAYRHSERGEVHVSASYVEDDLWLLVADCGQGMRAREDSPGLGLGLALIAQLSDELQIVGRGSGGTELRIRFDLSSDGAVQPSQSSDSVRARELIAG